MHLPLLVRALSLEKGRIAREAGIDPATLSRIARGRQYAADDTIHRIEIAAWRHLDEGVQS